MNLGKVKIYLNTDLKCAMHYLQHFFFSNESLHEIKDKKNPVVASEDIFSIDQNP